MAYKPTGRPPGRPKTKEYVTLLARVPTELAELVKRYARQHGQSVATLLREGVEWRIGDGDPRGMGMYLAQPTDTKEKVYHTNTETAVDIGGAELLREIRADQARLGEQLQAVMRAVEQRTSGTVSIQPSSEPGDAGTVGGDGDIPVASMRAQSAPAREYDATKYHLGKLCPHSHDYQGTGQSLLNAHGGCLACDKERAQARRAAKRQQATA